MYLLASSAWTRAILRHHTPPLSLMRLTKRRKLCFAGPACFAGFVIARDIFSASIYDSEPEIRLFFAAAGFTFGRFY